jgi:polygalacturonase
LPLKSADYTQINAQPTRLNGEITANFVVLVCTAAQSVSLRRTPRREFLAGTLGCLPVLAGLQPVAEILARIRPPRFPDRPFDVLRHGAAGDGQTDCHAAFQKAIAECHRAGGGRVHVPAGTFLSNGPIHLAGNVNLHLASGAKILFGTNPADYLPAVLTRWEGTRCHNYSPLIYALRQENIAITGEGVIDGQTRLFWHQWKQRQSADQNTLREMGARREPLERRVFGEGHYLRPSLFQPYDCRNVLVEGVTFQGSPFWTVHPVFCTNVTIRGIHVLPGTTNDDGVDPDSCRDVLIENCVFDTADDNIAIKAGRDQDAWGDRPCENIVVRNCTGVHSKANGYCIGSEM